MVLWRRLQRLWSAIASNVAVCAGGAREASRFSTCESMCNRNDGCLFGTGTLKKPPQNPTRWLRKNAATPYTFTKQAAFFVIRAKRNLAYRRRASRSVDKLTGVRSDQRIVLCGPQTKKEYPDTLRRISFVDVESKKRLVLLSNQFLLPSLILAQLYRCRWQVELFFKWIKQHLRIKAFFGTSENAISMYVLVAIMKKQLRVDRSLSEILQILTVSLFEKVDILQVLTKPHLQNEPEQVCNQLNLFDL